MFRSLNIVRLTGGTGSEERLYTYSIITTSSNKQLQFLHDRMPAILNNGSDEIHTWLDPGRAEWSKELQCLLKPYQGDLECYPVSKDVGKVGNNSPSFVVPLNSSENRNNIANFFRKQRTGAKSDKGNKEAAGRVNAVRSRGTQVEGEPEDDSRATLEQNVGDSNAPVPAPVDSRDLSAVKREHSSSEVGDGGNAADGAGEPLIKSQKLDDHGSIEEGHAGASQNNANDGSFEPADSRRPRKTRSATSNASPKGGRAAKGAEGSQKITSFFTK